MGYLILIVVGGIVAYIAYTQGLKAGSNNEWKRTVNEVIRGMNNNLAYWEDEVERVEEAIAEVERWLKHPKEFEEEVKIMKAVAEPMAQVGNSINNERAQIVKDVESGKELRRLDKLSTADGLIWEYDLLERYLEALEKRKLIVKGKIDYIRTVLENTDKELAKIARA